MIRYLPFCLFGLVFCGCQVTRPEPYHITLVHQIRDQFIEDVKRDRHLQVYVTGGGLTRDIDEITIGFASAEHVTIEEAREEFILLAENFLYRLNTWEQIRPYLHNFPATIANLSLKLIFLDRNRQNKLISDGKVAYVFVADGNIVYYTSNSETNEPVEIYEEPYEEALRIVRQQHPKP